MTLPRFEQDFGRVASEGVKDVPAGSVGSETPVERQTEQWRPCALDRFPLIDNDKLYIPPIAEIETFTRDFIVSTFGGQQWSPGFYWIPPGAPSLLKNRSYSILDPDHEPYLPAVPGAHGAKVTAVFNDTSIDENGQFPEKSAYEHIPLFISFPTALDDSEAKRCVYFGTYSRNRYCDRMDYDTQSILISQAVKEYWAGQLTSPERPDWATQKLIHHFWPKPTYKGPLPSASETEQNERKLQRAMTNYLEDLRAWEEETRLKVSILTRRDIMKAFDEPDAGAKPGLRLWWEYLCCTGWDKEFYDMLVYKKRCPVGPVSKGEDEMTKHHEEENEGGGNEGETEGVSDEEETESESAEEVTEVMSDEEEFEDESDDGIQVGESASGCDEAVGGAEVNKYEEAFKQAGKTRGLFAFGERDCEDVIW